MVQIEEKIRQLYQVITSIESEEDCKALFDDMCTRKEVEKMAERLYAARLLIQGMTYQKVIAETDISSATLSRVSQCVQYGQGYNRFLKKEGTRAE